MARFTRLMAMLLRQQVPLPEALRLTSKEVRNIRLARACRKAATEIEQGRSLSESIAAKRQFPADLLPLVELGERSSSLGEAFRSAAEMFEGRANTQGRNLEVFLLPATFLVIICLCGVFVIALFLPLIALITRLTGGGGGMMTSGPPMNKPPISALAVFYIVLILLAIVVLLFPYLPLIQKKIAGHKFYPRISLICWTVIICALIGGFFTAPSEVFSVFLVIAAIIAAALAVVYVLGCLFLQPRLRSQQNALLWTMAISAEKMIPLVPTIEAFARGHTGLIAAKARKLAELLAAGVPLPDALEQVPGILPPRTFPMICVGYETGALAKSLRQAASSRDPLNIVGNSLLTKLFYIALVATFGIFVLTFIMLRIVPSYEKIFKDFRTHLPQITISLISASDALMNLWYILLPIYILFLALIVHFIFYNLGWTTFSIPGLTRLLRRRHSAAILDSLALAAQCNQPLGNSITTLAGTYPQLAIRRKLCYVGIDVQRGADWCESLYRHGLINRSDRAVLQAAQRVGNLPWAMREMADSNRRRLAYRLNALVQLAYPPVILCLGAIVLFIMTALFTPLVALITRLSGQ